MLALVANWQTTQPLLAVKSNVLTLTLPGSALAHREVRKQLDSGLTTAFIAIVDASTRSGSIRRVLRIEVRYDLWDEAYDVRVIDSDGKVTPSRHASFNALAEWWTSTSFPLVVTHGDVAPSARLRLEVLPFSAGEEADVQRWLVQTVGSPPASTSENKVASSGALLDLLIGTSVQRRPIQSWRWTLPVAGAR